MMHYGKYMPKRYMKKILQIIDAHEHNRFWTSIITRGIVLYEWQMEPIYQRI